jgi:predicted MFS family arabinose efflux permease
VSFGYKNYLLTLLAVIVAFNGVDGVALSLLLQNIKLDLGLSDTQLGVLTGIAYALFYSIMGIPIARQAATPERTARRTKDSSRSHPRESGELLTPCFT